MKKFYEYLRREGKFSYLIGISLINILFLYERIFRPQDVNETFVVFQVIVFVLFLAYSVFIVLLPYINENSGHE